MDNNYNYNPVQPEAPKTNTMAIGALVCGVLAVILSLVWTIYTCVIALVLGIVGIVLGAKGMKVAKATGTGNGLAVGGLVCGIIGTVFAFAVFACVAYALCVYSSLVGSLAGLA